MSWAPKRKKRLSIAIPSSFVSDIPHLREKTVRVGLLARAAAMFRVDEVLIYRSTVQADSKEAGFLKLILSYLETPQYLRKRVFPLSPDMQYVGVLPPLRTPHHPVPNVSETESIAYRDGVVVASEKNSAVIEIGLADQVRLKASNLRKGSRVTVRIERDGQRERYSAVSRVEVPFYWGYDVSVSEKKLGETLRQRSDEPVVVTSRYGDPLLERIEDLKRELSEASRILVVFGSPKEGIAEILSRERLKPQDFTDLVLNMFPNQGTETVRTEEAVYATLGILNALAPMQD